MKSLLVGLLLGGMAAGAQTVRIDKIDPPNWFAQMPKPMLLVHGEGLNDATFRVSDARLRVERVVPSANGHWAQVWLSASPAEAETVRFTATSKQQSANSKQSAIAEYRFEARRKATDGMAGFSARDVVYLIMTDRFVDGDTANDGEDGKHPAESADAQAQRGMERGWHGGDLRGVQEHLDYLQSLGVTTLWTTPVYQNHEAMSYHGYGATDMYAVDEHYGTLADAKALAAALHARGMKWMLDTVPNHVGPGHPWNSDAPTPDWLHGSAQEHEDGESDFSALMNPHASDRDRRATLDGWFAGVLPDLNTDNPAVAQYLRQNIVWWIEETGADALRYDTFPYVNRGFWHDLNAELKTLYPRLTEVGETFYPDPVFVSSYAGGVTRTGVDTGLYTPFDFPTYFALRNVFLDDASMIKLNDVLADDSLYPHPERLPVFLGNHDTTRFREEAKSEAAMKLAFGFLFTTRGMPQLYSGDELAMRGHGDPDNRRDFPTSAFTAAGRTPEQARMFDWVQSLATVRREHPVLACGGEQVLLVSDNWLVTLRDGAHAPDASCAAPSKERVLVAIYRGAKTGSQPIPIDSTWMQGCSAVRPVLGEAGSSAHVRGDDMTVTMAPDSVFVGVCR